VKKALGEEVDGLLNSVCEFFISRQKPTIFDPNSEESDLIGNDRHFEELAASMEDNGVNSPKNLTVFEFYSRIVYFEKKAKAIEAATK